jgi:chromosome segregation ATPase
MLSELKQRILFEAVYEILATNITKAEQQLTLLCYAKTQQMTLKEVVETFVAYIKKKALLARELLIELSDISEQKEADLEQLETRNDALRSKLNRIRYLLDHPNNADGELVIDLKATEAELHCSLVESAAIRQELEQLHQERHCLRSNLEHIRADNHRIELGLYRLHSLLD